MKRYILRIALLISIVAILFTISAFALSTTDSAQLDGLESHWVQPYARVMIDRGILTGNSDVLLKPNNLVNREDLLSWIMKGWGGSYDDPVSAALELGILDEEMEISGPLTRNDAAKLSVRSLIILFDEADEGDDYLAALQLEDYDACHSCRGYVSQSYVRGLMLGRIQGTFGGEKMLTHAEGWTIVARMLDNTLRCIPEPESDAPVLLTADAAQRILDSNNNAVLLDVRSEAEHATGYIPGSICISLAELKETQASALKEHMQDPIIIYCQSGGRSAQAKKLLEELGFSAVFDIGGIDNWTFDLEYLNN